jgi:NarL family two-component system sensor histidine kinase LiaS
MNGRGSLGLQWALAAIYLAASALSAATAAAGYYIGVRHGLAPDRALAIGLTAGFIAGGVAFLPGFRAVRVLKQRLWEAGDLASRIARGDFAVRLQVWSHDEVGWLEEQLNAMAGHLETAVGELKRLAEQNRKLAEEAGRGAALEERARLARDLHDTVNQQLFVLAMRAAAARRRLDVLSAASGLPDAEVQGLQSELATLEGLAREAHVETRKLIMQLRPTTLEQQGLGPALAEYVQAAAAREGWTAHLAIDETIRLTGTVGENLFRIAQEALNNVAKHARARQVWIVLERNGDGLLLAVRDDGTGFDPQAGVRPTAVGLVGIQERVKQLGGLLRLTSHPGEGTEVRVLLPLHEEGSHDPSAVGG